MCFTHNISYPSHYNRPVSPSDWEEGTLAYGNIRLLGYQAETLPPVISPGKAGGSTASRAVTVT